MRGNTARVLGLAVAFAVGFLVLVGVWQGVSATSGLGYEPGGLPAVQTGAHSAQLSLSLFPDSYPCHGSGGGPHPDWVTFCPSTSLKVPAYSVITVTIEQYDGGTPVRNPFFGQVRGTVGGMMEVNGRPTRGLNGATSDIAHTFTIQSAQDSGAQLFVSVPLSAVPSSRAATQTIAGHSYPKPNVITFRFRTGAPGQYIWHCYDPCGIGQDGFGKGFGGAMSTTGYMAGTLTVTGT